MTIKRLAKQVYLMFGWLNLLLFFLFLAFLSLHHYAWQIAGAFVVVWLVKFYKSKDAVSFLLLAAFLVSFFLPNL